MEILTRYYDVLGLRTGASLPEVKLAYRRLVKKWHPDRFPHDSSRQNQGQRRMQEINAAYNQLKDVAAVRRRRGSWDNSYNIGIKNVDKQHQMFFKMFENFHNNYASSSMVTIDDEVKMQIYLYLLKLRRYAMDHFVTEEEYMVRYRYPNYTEHRKKHDAFIKQLFDLEERYYNLNNLSPNNISDFILSWLEGHIRGMDKDFGRYLNDVVGIYSIP